MKKIKSSLIALSALSVLSTACLKVEEVPFVKQKSSKRATNDRKTNVMVGDSETQLKVMSKAVFKEALLNKSMISVRDPRAQAILNSLPQGDATHVSAETSAAAAAVTLQEDSLIVGIPAGLIGEQNIFGGVITKVTDTQNEDLGTLKLTDLPPIHVRTFRTGDFLSLYGCMSKCDEDSQQVGLLSFPILGVVQIEDILINGQPKASDYVMVDFSSIGKELNLISMLDPGGDYTQLKTVSSDTTNVEYDKKTLVFDIKSKMIPLKADATDPTVKTTDFTVRWYLKLGSGFNPTFKSREPVKGVGFFTTGSSATQKITRFSTTSTGIKYQTPDGKVVEIGPVEYIIKNVPEQFKKSFAKAIDSWNVEFRKIIGKDLLSYRFVDANSPEAELYVPGDIRYNIIEWDLVNKASYGGLGPSIANQISGETMAAHVLVQGPTIVKLYTRWFEVSGKATKLLAEGKSVEANKLIQNFEASVKTEMESRKLPPMKVKIGKHLEMTVHSQRADLEDPIIPKEFELVPAGMTYEKYMEGYMVEILAHELGHNLGLRHNFKGNLGAYENNADEGSVSRSVMEYLGRPYRHLNTIGAYDRMAISYGYKGVQPKHLNWFCTDEDQGLDAETIALMSPECTKSDATSDPFSFWEGRLARIIDLVVETKSAAAPVWTLEDVNSQLSETVTGLAAYALSAEATADTWTNFFGKSDRPENKSEIKAYVAQKVKAKLCNPELTIIIASKESAEARTKAEENLKALTKGFIGKAAKLKWSLEKELDCTK